MAKGKKKSNISTVNVLESMDSSETNLSITSFPDNTKGNVEATILFEQIIKENGAKDEDVDSYVEDGIYENGDYKCFLIHSR